MLSRALARKGGNAQLDPHPQALVVLARHARDPEQGAQVVQIGASRKCQQVGAGGIVHPCAEKQLAERERLQQLHQRFGFQIQHRGCLWVARQQIRLDIGHDGLEVEQLHHCGGW